MQNKSEENWRVGTICLEADELNAAANRLYYSVFQAVFSSAKKKGYVRKRGQSVHTNMRRYIKNEAGTYERTFMSLRTLRETADYEPETPSKKSIDDILVKSENMKTYFLNR